MNAPLRLYGPHTPGDGAPMAYTGPYPIRSHRTLADQSAPDLRIEQDYADGEHARQVIRVYRIAPRQALPEPAPLMQRVALALGLAGGAMMIVGVITLMAFCALALGGGQ